MARMEPFTILGWQAWAPGLVDQEAWTQWLPQGGGLEIIQKKPANKDAPPMLRRRYSMPSRMMLETSINVCRQAGISPDQTHLIFGSANGEISTLGKLLRDLAQDQPMSPTAFSNSVHHVPTGHYSMVVKHKALSRTISSFEDTFSCCFLDAACLLQKSPQLPALIAIADELPHEPFDKMLKAPPFPYAIALLVGKGGERGTPVAFETSSSREPAPEFHPEPAFDFLRWLIGTEPELVMNTHFGALSWQKL